MWRRIRFLVPVLVLTLLLAPQAGWALEAGSAPDQADGVATVQVGNSSTDLLQELNQSLRSENESLKALNAALQAENEALKQENALLRSQLEAAQKQQGLEAQPVATASATVQELAAQLRSRVFRVDVYDHSGQLRATGSAVAVTTTDVVTNYHVVKEAWSAELVTEDGTRYPVLGMTAFDQNQDLAVLRVNGTLQPVQLRTTPVETGEEVVAIGSPVGLINTVSTGVVSAVRTLSGSEVIQVSAPISKGSSGGGLFDRQGSLIGITFGLMEGGQNLNFAIPVKYVQQLLSQVGAVQDLPGVNRVTPENLVAVLQESYPVLEVNGQQALVEYGLVPNPNPAPGDAADVLLIRMDREQYCTHLRGMVAGDFQTNLITVQDFVADVAAVADQAYGDQNVTVLLLHVGQYSSYPAAFPGNEVRYDLETGRWWVFHPELMVRGTDGQWAYEWQL